MAVNSGDSFENLDADATVYPNPVMIGAKVNIQFAQDTEATIQIIDVSGKVVRRETVTGVNHEISTEGFGRGLYILQIESGKNKITKKLVVN